MEEQNDKKAIEEMAKVICHAPNCEIKKNGGSCYKYCKAYIYAFRAINAGYRKQSELTPCDVCKFNPPSSGDGKPCAMCPAQAKGAEDEG